MEIAAIHGYGVLVSTFLLELSFSFTELGKYYTPFDIHLSTDEFLSIVILHFTNIFKIQVMFWKLKT